MSRHLPLSISGSVGSVLGSWSPRGFNGSGRSFDLLREGMSVVSCMTSFSLERYRFNKVYQRFLEPFASCHQLQPDSDRSPSVAGNCSCVLGSEVSASAGLMRKSLSLMTRTIPGWADGQLVGVDGNGM